MSSSRIRSASDRVAKWDKRFTAEHVSNIITTEKATFLQNNTASTSDLVHYETLTQEVLNIQGVPVIDRPDYLSFSREVWAKRRRMAGEALAAEVAVLVAKWTARTLQQSVLEAIRSQVYNVSAPTPGP